MFGVCVCVFQREDLCDALEIGVGRKVKPQQMFFYMEWGLER